MSQFRQDTLVQTMKTNAHYVTISGRVLGRDYTVQFQPGLKLSPVDRAEISARHRSGIDYNMQQRFHGETFSPG